MDSLEGKPAGRSKVVDYKELFDSLLHVSNDVQASLTTTGVAPGGAHAYNINRNVADPTGMVMTCSAPHSSSYCMTDFVSANG